MKMRPIRFFSKLWKENTELRQEKSQRAKTSTAPRLKHCVSHLTIVAKNVQQAPGYSDLLHLCVARWGALGEGGGWIYPITLCNFVVPTCSFW